MLLQSATSALAAAARAIAGLPQGRIDAQTTANVGTIKGGVANNIIAEHCKITGECRSHSLERLLALRAQINEVLTAACDEQTTVDISWEVNYDGFYVPEDAPVVALAQQAARHLNLNTACKISGGGADTNVFAAAGLNTVSLGTGMSKVHSTNEQLAVADLEALTALIIQIALLYKDFTRSPDEHS
jgi:tripeptide aminopeptidase